MPMSYNRRVISFASYKNWYNSLRIVHSLFLLLVFSGVNTDLKLCISFKTDHFRAIAHFMLYSIFYGQQAMILLVYIPEVSSS